MQGTRTKVLIAADDSEQSMAAALAARSLFGDDADYTVVSVGIDETTTQWAGMSAAWGVPYPMAIPAVGAVGPPLMFAETDRQDLPSAEQIAEQRAGDVAMAAHLPDATPMGEVGDAAEAILRAAATCGAHVIVVGSHDRGWFSRLVTPSVTEAVVRAAPVPVLVVGATST